VGRFNEVNVELLVVRGLPPPLGLLLLGVPVVVPVLVEALGEKFPKAAARDIREAVEGIPDPALAERTKSKGDHHAVEENHVGDVVTVRDRVLELRHEQQIAALLKPVVYGVVSDVAQDRADLLLVRTVGVNEGSAVRDNCGGSRGVRVGDDGGLSGDRGGVNLGRVKQRAECC